MNRIMCSVMLVFLPATLSMAQSLYMAPRFDRTCLLTGLASEKDPIGTLLYRFQVEREFRIYLATRFPQKQTIWERNWREVLFLGGSFATILGARMLGEKDFRIVKNDGWYTATGSFQSDKKLHFLGGMFLGAGDLRLAVYASLWKEIKDAVFPHERYGRFGSSGGSFVYDLSASLAGAGAGYIARKGIQTIIHFITQPKRRHYHAN